PAVVILWRLDAGGGMTQVGYLSGFARCVNSVQFSPDGNLLATGDETNRVRLFEVSHLLRRDSAAPPARLQLPQPPLPQAEGGTTGGTNCLSFSRDGRYVAAGSGDGTLQIWDLRKRPQNGRPAVYRNMDQGGIMSLCFSGDGRKLVVG